MAFCATPSCFLRSQRSESPSTSSSDLAVSPALHNPTTFFRITSDQNSLPSSLASMLPRLSFISLSTCPLSYQPSARRGHYVFLRLSFRTSHSTGHFSSSVPFVASSLRFVPSPINLVEHPSLVNRPSVNILEPASATILMDSITLVAQPLLPPPIASGALVVVNDLFSSRDLHDRKWPSD